MEGGALEGRGGAELAGTVEKKGGLRLTYALASSSLGALAGMAAGWAETRYNVMVGVPLFFVMPRTQYYALAYLAIPVMEELAKSLGLLLVKAKGRPALSLIEWTVLGMVAGLAFKMLEDALYALAAYSGMVFAGRGVEAALFVLCLRSLFPVHLICTCIVGFGIGLWDVTRDRNYFLNAVLASTGLHGLYNFLATAVVLW